MRRSALLAACAALGLAVAGTISTSGQVQEDWHGVPHQHPAIDYVSRPTTDRIAALNHALAGGARTLRREPRTGYLRSVLDALGLAIDSQLLVFSKTGVQRAFTNPHNPRALFFDPSVVVGYIPGAPLIEIAAHDPQQGVVFYTLDQNAAAPSFRRETSCLTCHVSATTLGVPGLIARSNAVGEDGNVMPQFGSNDVTHQTPHPDRWGGYFVTSEALVPYSQRAHAGNITFTVSGVTSNQVFMEWLSGDAEARGYPAATSDIVALLLFDHQVHAINLLTRLNWETRIAAAAGRATAPDGLLDPLVAELAGYLLYDGEAAPSVALEARPGFAERFAAAFPRDRRGRSLADLDLVHRLARYPCSYMVYSAAFDGLRPELRQAIYRRMVDALTRPDRPGEHGRASADDRRAAIEILRDTKADFPPAQATEP